MVSAAYAARVKRSANGSVDTTRLSVFQRALPVPERLRVRGTASVHIVETRHSFHPDLPDSPVWAYRSSRQGQGPGPLVLEADSGVEARVRWCNDLPHTAVRPIVGLGVMMAGAPGSSGMAPYRVGDTTTHLHGAHVEWTSDGHPVRVPGAATLVDPERSLTATYGNDQPGTTLWFHDHVMGETAANVYAGLVGMYLLRAPGEADLDLPGTGERDYGHEMPLILGDRSFLPDGEILYGATFSQLTGADIDPTRPGHTYDQASEFKGDAITVNDAVWPFLAVDRAWYRFRVVNAASSRFFRLVLRPQRADADPAGDPAGWPDTDAPPVPIVQIGGDGGFLPEPWTTGPDDAVVLAPGERADLLVDLTGRAAGEHLILCNEIDQESDNASGFATVLYGNGGDATIPPAAGTRLRTSLVMRLDVGAAEVAPVSDPRWRRAGAAVSGDLDELRTWACLARIRRLTLREIDRPNGQPALPQIADTRNGWPLGWYSPRGSRPAEVVGLGDVEIWEIENVSPDTHPIHLHLVQFLVLDRRPLGSTAGSVTSSGVDANEAGWKDTLRVGTGQITRFAVRFTDYAGRFVWHCHILEHEDMGMMRPLIVRP